MKIKNTVVLILTALSLTACGSRQALVSELDESIPQTVSVTDMTARTEQTTEAETVQSKPQTLASDLSNRNEIVSMTGAGGTVNILSKDKTEPLSAKSVMNSGRVEAVLAYTAGLGGYPSSEKAEVYFFVAVNGRLCEFEIAGEKSTGGMLHTKRNVNTELSDELVITDCELEKGENELCIMYTAYHPQLCAAYPTKLPKTFSSDCRTKQSKPVCRAQRYEDRFVYSSEKRDLSDSSDFVFDRIGYDQQKAWSEVNAGTDVSLRLINIDMKMTGTVKRNMLIFAMLDDKPIRLAGEKEFAFFRLEKTDCSVKIPLTKLEKNEKPRVLIVCCFDMSEAVWCLRTEHMFLVK